MPEMGEFLKERKMGSNKYIFMNSEAILGVVHTWRVCCVMQWHALFIPVSDEFSDAFELLLSEEALFPKALMLVEHPKMYFSN